MGSDEQGYCISGLPTRCLRRHRVSGRFRPYYDTGAKELKSKCDLPDPSQNEHSPKVPIRGPSTETDLFGEVPWTFNICRHDDNFINTRQKMKRVLKPKVK